MLTDGLDRLSALCSSLEAAEAAPEDQAEAARICDAIEDLSDKHYYVPPYASRTTRGPEGAGLVGLGEEGSEKEEEVYRACESAWDALIRLEEVASSGLEAKFREEDYPSPDENLWIENKALQWAESHVPGLLNERLEREGKKK
jgi:hypothetical protein